MEISGILSGMVCLFFCGGDASTREMLSSGCLYFSLRPPWASKATISAYGLIHCALDHQEEYSHCNGESHQAGQVCLC